MNMHEQSTSTVTYATATADLIESANRVDLLESARAVNPDERSDSPIGDAEEMSWEVDPADALEQAQEIGYDDDYERGS